MHSSSTIGLPSCPFIPILVIPTVIHTIRSCWPKDCMVTPIYIRIKPIEPSTHWVPQHCNILFIITDQFVECFSRSQKVLSWLEAANEVQTLWARGQVMSRVDNYSEMHLQILWSCCWSTLKQKEATKIPLLPALN